MQVGASGFMSERLVAGPWPVGVIVAVCGCSDRHWALNRPATSLAMDAPRRSAKGVGLPRNMTERGAGDPSEPALPSRGPAAPRVYLGRRWRIVSVVLVVVVLLGLGTYIVVGRRGGGDGSCLHRAVEHLEQGDDDRGVRGVRGGHLARARAAGMDDSGSRAEAAASVRETAVHVDPLTDAREVRGDPGYDLTDVTCWVGALGSEHWCLRPRDLSTWQSR